MNTTPTVDYHRQAFDHYNTLIFGGKLPVPKLKLSRAKTRLGQMACKRKMRLGRTTYYDYCISISNYYQLTMEETDDVLIHEMIHYTIAYTGLKDTAPHGIVFQGMMDKPYFRQTHHHLRAHTQPPTSHSTTTQELSHISVRDERWQVFPFLRQPLFRKEIVALSCSHA